MGTLTVVHTGTKRGKTRYYFFTIGFGRLVDLRKDIELYSFWLLETSYRRFLDVRTTVPLSSDVSPFNILNREGTYTITIEDISSMIPEASPVECHEGGTSGCPL